LNQNLDFQVEGARADIGSDQCIIDQKWFFIRGCLDIPVVDSPEPFVWGLWALVREEVYDEISDTWEKTGREKVQGPFKGRLANSLSVYADISFIQAHVCVHVGEIRGETTGQALVSLPTYSAPERVCHGLAGC